MTLYGLDLIQDQEGKYHLLEVNGIKSGMNGFKHIYGDDRIEEKVYQMLQQRYGKVTVNDNSYFRLQYQKEHPLKYRWKSFIAKLPFLQREEKLPRVLSAPTARVDWLREKVPVSYGCKFPFESYTGQESAVLSVYYHEELPHPLVNPYLTEAIAHNKFFTYQVLKDSEIKELVPRSTLLGLGFTHERELEELLETSSQFVIKPILGSQGRGIEIISQRVAQQHRHSRGLADFHIKSKLPLKLIPLYVENMIAARMFSFEYGLGIIQPFINSRQRIHGKKMYTSIRAIVCNEKFVDAYARVSPHKKVNLSQGANAYPCNGKDKEQIASLSEKIVAIFEERCLSYDTHDFEQKLYQSYIDSRGKTTAEMRTADVSRESVAIMTYATNSVMEMIKIKI